MLLQFILVMLIVLCTLYWTWQGAFSSAMMLIAALFGSALAMGVHESLIPYFIKFRPDFARPVMFFLVFAFACSGLRLLGGIVVSRRVKMPKWLDLSLGGVLGFLVAMVCFGTFMIGIEMLPGYQKILEYDRYPNGLAKEPERTWLRADDFVQWTWGQLNGGSLGGQSMLVDHPDLDRELFGYRHVVTFGSNPVIPPDLLEVPAVYVLKASVALEKLFNNSVPNNLKLNGETEKIVVVRSVVNKGVEWPNISCDKDNLYRITPAQVRLVTSEPQQYYPIGYMENGQYFKTMNLETGHVVWAYAGDKTAVVSDWVFKIPADAEPRYFEEKQARRNITELAAAASNAVMLDTYSMATGNAYPADTMTGPLIQISLRHNVGEATDQPVANQDVYLLRHTIIKRRVLTEMTLAYHKLEDSTILSPAQKLSYQTQFRDMAVATSPDADVAVLNFIRLMFVAHETSDSAEDARTMGFFIENTILPIIRNPDNNLVAWGPTSEGARCITGADGKTPTKRVSPGSYTVLAWSNPKGLFQLWVNDETIAQAAPAPGATEPLKLIKLEDQDIRYARP